MKRFALLSTYDKTGIVPLARHLVRAGYTLLSTGGTARVLREAGFDVVDVADHTQYPELMGGRLKTIHPLVHGGMLFRRGNEGDLADVAEHSIVPIDVAVVNLYPFEKTAEQEGVKTAELIEQIDIGGPTMLRSAAKNFDAVTVIVDPDDYREVIEEMDDDGNVPDDLRAKLAIKVFWATAHYNAVIAEELERRLGLSD